MNLQQLRRLDADAEAAIRRISIIKLTATILIVYDHARRDAPAWPTDRLALATAFGRRPA